MTRKASKRTSAAVRKSNDMRASVIARANQSLGIWQGALNGFQPRLVNPYFYDALRSAVGFLDGGIGKLVTMDGILDVEGGNDKLVQTIQNELFKNIPVNDLEGGLQVFYASGGDAMHEQGFMVGELVMDKRGREVIGLRQADSKGIVFFRDGTQLSTWYRPPAQPRGVRMDGSDAIETVLRNNGLQVNATQTLTQWGFVQLDPATMVYGTFNSGPDRPYGVSVMRSIEFVSQILVKIENATGLAWDRFGDPSFHLVYQTKNRALKAADFDKRQQSLATDLQTVLNAKRSGNSADFVQAIGADDQVTLKVIGSDNSELKLDMPAAHMAQQILARLGLPAWMLGIDVMRASSALSDQQAEIVIQDSKTRFARRLPGLERIVVAWLRGRGLTWKPGDWQLVQRLPNLYDELKRAQAAFLQAQTQMMLSGRLVPGGNLGANDGGMGNTGRDPAKMFHGERAHRHTHKADDTGEDDGEPEPAEPWADPDPQLPKIESAAIDALQTKWNALLQRVKQTLNLSSGGDVAFTFDASTMLAQLANDQQWFIDQAGADDGPYLQQVFASWAQGVINAASDVDAEQAADDLVEQTLRDNRAVILQRQLSQVRNTTVRTFQNDIVAALQDGVYNGINPATVAAQLESRFGVHDYDWLRLARSEIAAANAKGKLQGYVRNGFLQYDFITAPGACPICTGLEAGGPYMIGAGPLPVDDSHPNCRCTTRAVMPES